MGGARGVDGSNEHDHLGVLLFRKALGCMAFGVTAGLARSYSVALLWKARPELQHAMMAIADDLRHEEFTARYLMVHTEDLPHMLRSRDS